MLEEWSDNPETRFDFLSRSYAEYLEIDEDREETANPAAQQPEPIAIEQPTNTLTYQQQLTIAALNGLCANPAYCNQYDDLPGMANWLASSIIRQQENNDAC
jgi:exodeoxyribonuclease VIII